MNTETAQHAFDSDTTDAAAAAPPPAALRDIDALPGPRSLPWIGNLLDIRAGQLHLQLERWAAQHGSMFRVNFGPRRAVAITDHAVIADVLRRRPHDFRRTARLEEMWLEMGFARGVFGANGEAWQRQRRMVMAGFDPRHVKAYFPALAKVTQRLRGRWARAAAAGSELDLQAELMRFTVDAITGLAFGADINTLESDDEVIQQHLDKIFPALFTRILQPFPLWRYVKRPADRALERSVAEVKRAIDGFIAQARQRLEAEPQRRAQPGNLLEAMIVAADEREDGSAALDHEDVAGNVLTMLLAGEDTTANTLAWMIHLLWKHPEALREATAEVRRVVGDAEWPTHEQLGGLNYIEACIHETMRLKPVAPMVPQQALHDCVVGDVRIPAGTVLIPVMRYDSLRDEHFTEATRFDPHRWLGSHASTSAKRVSMPFGAGPRVCPGRYLALLEMKMAMAMLLGRFDIDSVHTAGGGEPAEHLAFTMAPVGLRMRLRPRAESPRRLSARA